MRDWEILGLGFVDSRKIWGKEGGDWFCQSVGWVGCSCGWGGCAKGRLAGDFELLVVGAGLDCSNFALRRL